MFDKFCVLLLAYQDDDFITMLAPVRDYLSPRNLRLVPLLVTVSTQFLHLQISTFDKSLIPTLTDSRMEIASLPLPPLYSYPLTTLLSR